MAKRLLFIRHPTAAADVFVGKEGELTVDLDRDEFRVHDGVTAGGHAAARKDLANVAAASTSNDGKMTQAQVTALANVINDLVQEILDRVADVDSEETARFNADAAVTSAFQLADSNVIAAYEAADTNVIAAYEAADTALGLLITDNANAIAAEAVTRGNADTALASDISALDTALTDYTLTDYASVDQVVDNALRYGGASAAGTDTYAVNLPISPGAYAAGQRYSFIADVANTGACTINFNAIGARNIKMQDGSDPYSNAIAANQMVEVIDNGTNMLLLNPEDKTSGTWTPVLQDTSLSPSEGQTYSTQSGVYKRIGDVVFITGEISLTSLGTLSTGSICNIGGLPFAASAALPSGCITFGYARNLSITAGVTVVGRIPTASSAIYLDLWNSTSGTISMDVSQVTASGNMRFSGFYLV